MICQVKVTHVQGAGAAMSNQAAQEAVLINTEQEFSSIYISFL
jgi:hypothetical protein